MFDERARAFLEKSSNKLLIFLERRKVHPLHLTLLGLFLAFVAAGLLGLGYAFLALFIWYLSRLCDGLDGLLARHLKKSSLFGAYLDILCDMIAYSLMIIGLFFAHKDLSLLWLLILFGYILCITSALSLGSLSAEISKKIKTNRLLKLASGLAEAGETSLYYTLCILFPKNVFFLTCFWALVLLVTVLSRTYTAKKLLNL